MRRSELDAVTVAMRSPAFELDTGEAAAVLSAFDTARAAGHRFDPFTVALVDVLRRQLLATDANSDEEPSVEDGYEADDYGMDEEAPVEWAKGRRAVA